jgi:hypothetical protein
MRLLYVEIALGTAAPAPVIADFANASRPHCGVIIEA